MIDPILFGDYMTANPLDQDNVDPKLYEDCGNFDRVSIKFNQLLILNLSSAALNYAIVFLC